MAQYSNPRPHSQHGRSGVPDRWSPGGLADRKCDVRYYEPFTLTGDVITLQASGGSLAPTATRGCSVPVGEGTYAISLPDGLSNPGTMPGGGGGSAEGHSNNGTETFILISLNAAAGCGH